MKALKTVAVALGITLAALIVIPLAVLAGLFVWLKLTEEADEEILELDQRRRLIESTRPIADDATAGSPDPSQRTPAGPPAGVGLSGRRAPADRRSPSSAYRRDHGRCGRATSSSSRAPSTSSRRSASRSSAIGLAADRPLLILLAGGRARSGCRAATSLQIALLGVIGFGCYQILWTIGAPDDPRRRLGAAHRDDAGHDRAARGGGRARTRSRPRELGGVVRLVRRRRDRHRRGPGSRPRRLADRRPLTLGAAACWAIYTVVRRDDPASPLAARDHDLGDRRRHDRSGADRDRPARDRRRRRRVRGSPGIVLAILYSGILAAGLANVVVFHGVKLLGPTRITALQSLVPAMAVVLAAIFLGEPIRPGPGRRRRDHPRRRGPPPAVVACPRSASSGVARMTRRRRSAPPVRPLRPGEPPLAILVDYDGTIALTDVSDTVMAEHVPGDWEAEAAAYDAGLDGIAPADDAGDGAGRRDPAGAARDRRGPAARSGVRAVRPARAGGRHPGRGRLGRVRVLHRAGARGARRRGAAGRHGTHDVRRAARLDRISRTATRPASCAAPASAAACSSTRPPAAPSSSSATARAIGTPPATAMSCSPSGRSSGSASRPAGRSIAGPSSARSTRGWRRPSRPGARIRRRLARPAARPFFCGPEVWGEGRRSADRGRGRPVLRRRQTDRLPRVRDIRPPDASVPHVEPACLSSRALRTDRRAGVDALRSSRLVWLRRAHGTEGVDLGPSPRCHCSVAVAEDETRGWRSRRQRIPRACVERMRMVMDAAPVPPRVASGRYVDGTAPCASATHQWRPVRTSGYRDRRSLGLTSTPEVYPITSEKPPEDLTHGEVCLCDRRRDLLSRQRHHRRQRRSHPQGPRPLRSPSSSSIRTSTSIRARCRPYQHGEVFVTDDGAETDLDLGPLRALHRREPDPAQQRHDRAASTRRSSPRSVAATTSAARSRSSRTSPTRSRNGSDGSRATATRTS